MRKALIAGNWKMHGSVHGIAALLKGLKAGLVAAQPDIDVLLLPAFPHLSYVHDQLAGTAMQLGAQNLYVGRDGAFTGEVSGAMLKELGCRYVLVGHSERRTLFHESLFLIADKFKAAVDSDLTPILCVGETRAEREAGDTEAVVSEQISSVIGKCGIDMFQKAVIAYEPVWAIGTGLTATPDEAQAVHALIRSIIAKNNVDIASTIRILYGGSMKPDNAASLLVKPDIDGGLVGGASLDADSFLAICGVKR